MVKTINQAKLLGYKSFSKGILMSLPQVLCALVSSDQTKQRWVQAAGIVKLLQRLTLDSHTDIQVLQCCSILILKLSKTSLKLIKTRKTNPKTLPTM